MESLYFSAIGSLSWAHLVIQVLPNIAKYPRKRTHYGHHEHARSKNTLMLKSESINKTTSFGKSYLEGIDLFAKL